MIVHEVYQPTCKASPCTSLKQVDLRRERLRMNPNQPLVGQVSCDQIPDLWRSSHVGWATTGKTERTATFLWFTMVYPPLSHASSSMNWTSGQWNPKTSPSALRLRTIFPLTQAIGIQKKPGSIAPYWSSSNHNSWIISPLVGTWNYENTYFADKQTCMLSTAIDRNNHHVGRV